jgi:hypothetical protein
MLTHQVVDHISAQLQKGCTFQEYTHSPLNASAVLKHDAKIKKNSRPHITSDRINAS